jgi:hypothetical protein
MTKNEMLFLVAKAVKRTWKTDAPMKARFIEEFIEVAKKNDPNFDSKRFEIACMKENKE